MIIYTSLKNGSTRVEKATAKLGYYNFIAPRLRILEGNNDKVKEELIKHEP